MVLSESFTKTTATKIQKTDETCNFFDVVMSRNCKFCERICKYCELGAFIHAVSTHSIFAYCLTPELICDFQYLQNTFKIYKFTLKIYNFCRQPLKKEIILKGND